jgi:hypothetical protein
VLTMKCLDDSRGRVRVYVYSHPYTVSSKLALLQQSRKEATDVLGQTVVNVQTVSKLARLAVACGQSTRYIHENPASNCMMRLPER